MTSDAEPVRITVEISRAEPLRGTIAERDRPVQAFNGWTAFAAAMAAIVGRISSSRQAGSADEVAGG